MTPEEYELLEDQFSFRQITAHTWMIDTRSQATPMGCTCYLLEGTKNSIMIDAGMSLYNLKDYIITLGLTDKPCLGVINTHAHFDHTAANSFWGHAYMHPAAKDRCRIPLGKCDLTKYSFDYDITLIREGDTIDLGDRTLRIYEIPAHDASSIAILDEGEKMLFAGDELDTGWLMARIPLHYQQMLRLKAMSDQFDSICCGHHGSPIAKESIDDFIECDRRILSGLPGDTYIPHQAAEGAPRPPQMRVMRYRSAHMMYMQDQLSCDRMPTDLEQKEINQ